MRMSHGPLDRFWVFERPKSPEINLGQAASRGRGFNPALMVAKLSHLGIFRRMIPLCLIVAFVSAVFALGLPHYLTLDSLHKSEATFRTLVADHWFVSAAGFTVLYACVVGLSIPGGTVMTVSGGFLFGLWTGSLLSVIGATAGAIIIFLAARFMIGDALRTRAGPLLARMAAGFEHAAFNYLLFLRLVPLFPFWAVNLAPALLGMRVRSFVAATAIGIIPGTLAYAAVGDGLGRYFEANSEVALNTVLSPEMIALRIGLALLALLPVVVQWARRRWQQ